MFKYGFKDYVLNEVNEHLKNGLIKIEGLLKDSEEVRFYCKDGSTIIMFHDQNCCESVTLESADSIDNNDDIYTNCDWCELEETTETGEGAWCHYTWTFYKVKTNKGYDTIRWYGSSNGYYSERVNFAILEDEKDEYYPQCGQTLDWSDEDE